uniref:Uncharacterized protein n=1 Tax=Panagrellus redivivus TaxID=6233 RepID=A0A7E4UM65_PANRE
MPPSIHDAPKPKHLATPENDKSIVTVTSSAGHRTSIIIAPVTMADPALLKLPDRPYVDDDDFVSKFQVAVE